MLELMTPESIIEAENRVQVWLEEHSDVVGEDLVSHWRERIADSLDHRTPDGAAEANAGIEALNARIAALTESFKKKLARVRKWVAKS